MSALLDAAFEIETVCRSRSFVHCFIGGIAVQRWGRPRTTVDVDLTLLTGFGGEEPFVDALLGSFRGRIADAREFALRHRTLLLYSSTAIPLDVSLGAMPFEEHSIARASKFGIGAGRSITTCGAEDLVVHKVFAGRDKDWLDVDGIVTRQTGRLDHSTIWDELLPLLELKDDTTSADRLRTLLGRGV
jgi:hypothetical protein